MSVQTQSIRFRWNAGAWFGSVIGSTLWMIVTAGFLLANSQTSLAAIPVGGFLFTNAAAWIIWTRREHLSPTLGLISITGMIIVISAAVWLSVATWGSPESLQSMSWPTASTLARSSVFLLVPAAIMLTVRFLNRADRSKNPDVQP